MGYVVLAKFPPSSSCPSPEALPSGRAPGHEGGLELGGVIPPRTPKGVRGYRKIRRGEETRLTRVDVRIALPTAQARSLRLLHPERCYPRGVPLLSRALLSRLVAFPPCFVRCNTSLYPATPRSGWVSLLALRASALAVPCLVAPGGIRGPFTPESN